MGMHSTKEYSDYDRRRMRLDLIGMIICFVAAAIIIASLFIKF